MFSNRYIFIYSSVMVIIVAVLLSTAAMVLKPFQDKNVKIEKMQNILASANIEANPANAFSKYEQYIIEELIVDTMGQITHSYQGGKFGIGTLRAFDINLKLEQKAYEDLRNGKSKVQPNFPIFVCQIANEKLFIIPILGKGLWGPIWGNIAFKSDMNTIVGATFDHKAETPGLGAEISTKEFQKQFFNKQIFDEKGDFVSVKVVKGGVAASNINPLHGVDAISGGTITCDALSETILDNLALYKPFLKKYSEASGSEKFNNDEEANKNPINSESTKIIENKSK